MGTLKNTEEETKSPAIRPSSPANPDCKDPTHLATGQSLQDQKAVNARRLFIEIKV
jgi:hypothetical protein